MATIATIDADDVIANSRTDINTNFANLNSDKIETSVIDIDTALTANSDAKIPSQKAVKAYVDSGGNPLASETSKGIVQEATDAQVTAGTATGVTGARLFINPSKLSLAKIYPVGSVYINAAVSTNPATLLGFGTWTAFGTGQVLVGVDAGQTEFTPLGKTGGEKTHQLTTAELASHSHSINGQNLGGSGIVLAIGGNPAGGSGTATSSGSAGSDTAHNNLQPYITVYMWQRTA